VTKLGVSIARGNEIDAGVACKNDACRGATFGTRFDNSVDGKRRAKSKVDSLDESNAACRQSLTTE